MKTQLHNGQKIDKEVTPRRGITELWHWLLQRATTLHKGSVVIWVLLVVG